MSDFDMYESEIEDLYREPEEPKVELTVEEAKLIQKLLRHCYFATDIQEVEELVLVQDGFLKERIEQAESQCSQG